MGLAPLSVTIIILSVIFSSLAIIAVCMRVAARLVMRNHFGVDDYLIFPALIAALGLGADTIVGASLGNLGGHTLPPPGGAIVLNETLIVFLRTGFASQLLAIVCLCFSKLSIVFLYRRIFCGRTFRIYCWILIGIITASGLSFFFAALFSCHPILPGFIGQHGRPCPSYSPVFLGAAISNMIIDIMILTAPIPVIWMLQMPVRLRLGVTAIFLMGFFVTGTSVARIYFFYQVVKKSASSVDQTYIYAPALYWSQLESANAVVCACLPTLKPLLRHIGINSAVRSLTSRLTVPFVGKKRLRNASNNNDNMSFRDGSSLENLTSKRAQGNKNSYEIAAKPPGTADSDQAVPYDGIGVGISLTTLAQTSSPQSLDPDRKEQRKH